MLRPRRYFYSLFLFSRIQEGVGEGHQGAPFDKVFFSRGFSTEQQYLIGAQSITSLMTDHRQDRISVSSFSRCLNETLLWRDIGVLTCKRSVKNTNFLSWVKTYKSIYKHFIHGKVASRHWCRFTFNEANDFGPLESDLKNIFVLKELFSLFEFWKVVIYLDRSPDILTADDFIRSNKIIRTKWLIY